MAEEGDYPAAWRPDQDDPKSIKGTVAGVAMGPDMGFGTYPIVTLDLPGGEQRAIHAFHQVLRSELARRRPKRGDELEVVYQGKRAPKSGNGNDFHVYKVFGGSKPEFDWDSELPEDERQPSSEPPIAPAPITREPVATAADKAAETFGSEVPF